MKPNERPLKRHEKRRQDTLRQMARIGPFLEGCLCSVKRRGCRQPGWHLTFKKKGTTRTVYVPMALVEEVKTWTREYRRLKKLVRNVTTQSLAIVHGHVASQRVENRNRASMQHSRPSAPRVSSAKRSRG